MPFFAEGSILTLEIVSSILVLFLLYLILFQYPARHSASRPIWVGVRGVGFVALVAASLAIIHSLTKQGKLDQALLGLLLVWLLCALYYFLWIRKDWPDPRVRYTMVLWASFWLLTDALLLYMWWAGNRIEFISPLRIDGGVFSQFVSAFTQVAGILVAATMVVVANRMDAEQADKTSQENAQQADRTARQEIYQNLEIESIELFRFENDNPELVRQLWYPDQSPATSLVPHPSAGVRRYLLKQYTCQILNLFEMAFRFRREGIILPDIFGSWVIWMWELCSAPGFRDIWFGEDGACTNYIPEFRATISKGVEIDCHDKESGNRKFFKEMHDALDGCEVVLKWLERPALSPASHLS